VLNQSCDVNHPAYYVFGETATPEEQAALKLAHENGAIIEAKGRDSIYTEYVWGKVETPKWNFKNNYYRIKNES
jgi:hypothetical protein